MAQPTVPGRVLSGHMVSSAEGTPVSSLSSASDAKLQSENELLKAEIECLRMQQAAGRGGSRGGGRGKNKQTMFNTDDADVSNKVSLHSGVAENIWPKFKFLRFTGNWQEYDMKHPHQFAKYVMRFVTIPQSHTGRDHKYYEEFVLPNVSGKLSTLRSNFVTSCGREFKSKLLYYMCSCA